MKKVIILLMFIIGFSSCENFLDREPYDKIDAKKYFKTERDLEIYSNYFLEAMTPTWESLGYGDRYVDYLTNSKFHAFYTGNWSANDQGGWSTAVWGDLRNVNYFLDNMHNVKSSDAVLNHYEGVGRFWRAWFYYSMVRTFGDVPWYEHELNPKDEQSLYKGRDSRELVMDKVLADLEYASKNCSTNSTYVKGSCRINRWTALAFMSRVCLFEGTYRKYHTELNLGSSADKFLQAAADAAKELMDKGPYKLVDSPTAREIQYRELFIANDLNETEIILGESFIAGVRSHYVSKNYYSLTAVGESWGFTKQFVNTYLTTAGTPFTNISGYKTIEFKDEFKDRDLRMKQTMRSPGYIRTIKGVPMEIAPDVKVSPTAYQPIKWCLDDDVYDNMESFNDLSILRFGEVLLNFAEAKAELGTLTQSDWDKSIKLLRERAGIKSVVPTVADPYLIDYYMNQTTDKWILEVRRERTIELALEGLRQDDLYRWKLGELLVKPWQGIYIPAKNVSYDLNGDGKKDIAVCDKAGSEAGVEYLVIGGAISLSQGTKGYIQYANPRIWEERKYLRPIPQTATQANPNLKQNPGWSN